MAMTRRQRKIALLKIFCVEALILLVLIILYNVSVGGKVYKKVYYEAGSAAANPQDFIKKATKYQGTLTADSVIDMTTPGTYPVKVTINNRNYKSKAIVRDTVAPTGMSVSDAYVMQNSSPDPSKFITDVKDATKVTVAFKKKYDFSKLGDQIVEVVLKDAGGNTTVVAVGLTVTDDVTPPVISGVEDLTAAIGDTITYKANVSVTDDKDDNVQLSVDSSNVNVKEPGVYKVVYSATDNAGNTATESANITITEPKEGVINEDTINYYANQILDQIIKPDMTEAQKAFAIYNWTRTNIGYVNTSEKDSWLKGAYQGFTQRSGDCFIYFSTAKALLTAAGIDNVDIVKSDTSHSQHFWSLVDVGTGYYHYDTTPRVGDGDNFFMRTDEELQKYSESHNNSHIFDASLYPERAKESFDEKYTY